MNQQTNTQGSNGYGNRNQSTKFDLEALRANDQQEIKNVAGKYPRLINSLTKHHSSQSHTECAYVRNMSSQNHWTPAACS
jgi:hypothetical protein